MTVGQTEGGVCDAVIIGAGFAGVCLGKRLRDAGITNFRIVDKAARPGGTWHWNRYPGAACDVQSHFYCFSFAPNPDWSRKYSPWDEIQAYAERCADKYGLRPHLELGREVKLARFDDASGLWEVSCTDGGLLRTRHVIDGSGGLHLPSIPRFAGAESFAGASWHSSQWRHDVNLAGQRVAVIGSAASAVQIVPEIAKTAGHVTLFQRTPNWVIPRRDRAYRRWEKWAFRHLPAVNRLYRLFLFLRYDWLAYPIVRTAGDSLPRRWAVSQFRRLLNESIPDPDLRAKLTPDFPIGCKRVLLSDDFFSTLTRDNVTLVTDPIERFTRSGIRTTIGAGKELEYPADVIVYATGFDTQGHHLEERVLGPGGRSLREAWAEAPMAYEGCMVAGFPNYHFVTGPNTGVGSTSVIFMIEQAANLILQCIEAAGENGLIAPTEQAMRAYDREIQAALAGTVWAGGCKSWYKRADGRITSLYPFSAQTWRARHRTLRREHFDIWPRRPA